MGQDVFFLSISIDSKVDTPDMLARYRKAYGHSFTGWLHLTGDFDEIEALRRSLGVYDLDPVLDADKTQHAGILTFGNDETDWWLAVPAESDHRDIWETVVRYTNDRPSPHGRIRPG